MLGTLLDLHRIEADDLIGKPIRHFIQHGNASLGVKIPSFDDRITPDELSAKFGNAVLAVGNFGGELSQLQLARLRVVGQPVAAMLGKVALPCSDIVVARRASRCVTSLAGALNRPHASSDTLGEVFQGGRMAGDTRFYFLHDFSMWVREAALEARPPRRLLVGGGGKVMLELGGDCLVVFPSDHRGEFIGDLKGRAQ